MYIGWAVLISAGLAGADVVSSAVEAPAVSPLLVREGPLAEQFMHEVELKPALMFQNPGRDDEWLEGAATTIRWMSAGPVRTVRLFYYGDLTADERERTGQFLQYHRRQGTQYRRVQVDRAVDGFVGLCAEDGRL